MKEFLNEFKSLEKLCNEIYGETSGVTKYINDMAGTPAFIAGRIPGWENDLANLKKVRHIRNQIAHEANYSDDDYEQEDVEFIRRFHQRILDCQDPLALRRQLTETKPQARVKKPNVSAGTVSSNYAHKPYYSNFTYNIDNSTNKNKNALLKRIAIGTVILMIIILWILIKMA